MYPFLFYVDVFVFRQISSIKGELIPHLVKKQFYKPKVKKQELPNPNESVIEEDVKKGRVSQVHVVYKCMKYPRKPLRHLYVNCEKTFQFDQNNK